MVNLVGELRYNLRYSFNRQTVSISNQPRSRLRMSTSYCAHSSSALAGLSGRLPSHRARGGETRALEQPPRFGLLSLVLAVLLMTGPALPQDDRPKFSLPEPQMAERRPAGSFTITELEYQLAGPEDCFPIALPEVVRFFREADATRKIGADLNWNQLRADDPHLKQAGLAYMTGNQAVLHFDDAEKKGLGEYLTGGGLLYAEDIRVSGVGRGLRGRSAGLAGTPFDQQFKILMRDPLVLGENGARWEPMPKNHPLYTLCYDFSAGPPMGGAPGGSVCELEALEQRGRVMVIFSDLNISWYWGDPLAISRDHGLRFAANLIVFAMAQQAARAAMPSAEVKR